MQRQDVDQVAIAVPARNEAARLPALLSALSAQVGAPRFTLCLLFDGCDDESEAIVAALAPALPFALRVASQRHDGGPNAGRARAAAMLLAREAAPDGVLLTTDADGEPSPRWVDANIAALAHADVVMGRIVRAGGRRSERQDRIEHYYDRLHALRRAIDPVSWEAAATHHWTSAASLGLRAATYRALDGFAAVRNGEDAALCDAAMRAGYGVRRDAEVVVRTSARRVGRACGGFAAALARLDGVAEMPMVTHPEDEAWRFGMHAAARRRHGARDYAELAAALGLPRAEVERVAAECRNGEAFAARIVGAPRHAMREVAFAQAERLLAGLERARLGNAA